MMICGHSDRSERLKSPVKSEGKPTHAQSIFQLHYTSNMEFLPILLLNIHIRYKVAL